MYKWDILIVGCFFIALVAYWIKELLFYKKHDWDFTQSTGVEIWSGEIPGVGSKMSNRVRVVWGFPMFIATCLSLLMLLVFA